MTRLTPRPPRKPSFAECAAELRDATTAMDDALSDWWRNSETDIAEVSTRWWLARKAFHEAILEPQQAAS